ncbi:MAG: hypothetical protein ACXWW5_05465, partial [Actinomycetota bacterium]
MTREDREPRLDEDDLPLDAMNEVVPNLWIGDGDAQPDAAFADGFEVVVNLAGYTRDLVDPPRGRVYVSWPIEDSHIELPDESMLRSVVDLV